MKNLTPIQKSPFCCYVAKVIPLVFDESMSYYETLCALKSYLENTVIPAVNEDKEAINEIQELVAELQEYITTYFENLDVQEEVNNKLDEMAQDGTLDEILNNYVNTTRVIGTTSSMLEDTTLVNGEKVRTLGYYSINDGGGAEFIVTNTASVNEYQLELENDLYATMIIKDDTIDFRQLGAKAGDNTFDNKDILLVYVSICNTMGKTLKLIMSEGEWYFSPTHICRIGGVNIQGISGFPARGYMGAKICPINSTQDYIWKFGGVADMNNTQLSYTATNTSNVLKNLTFSTGSNKVTYGCLVLEYANYGVYEDIYFNTIIGTGLYIRSSWENYFSRVNFRSMSDFSKPSLYFATARTIEDVSANISASSFDNLMFENCCGNLIVSDIASNLVNNQFNEINVENSYNALLSGEAKYNVTQGTDLTTMTPLYVFYGVGLDNTFGTINYTGLTARENYWNSVDNVNYYFQGIFGMPNATGTTEGNIFNNVIDNIFLRRDCTILTTNTIFTNGFKFSCANIVSSAHITKRFELNSGAGQINVLNFTDRVTATNSVNTHTHMLNSIELYKYGINGTIYNDETALNDLGLVLKKSSSSTTILTKLYFPYEYSETTKRQFNIRVKGTGSFTLRGLVDGENDNKVYNLVSSEDWQTITVDMNYDLYSPITIITGSADIEFDTLTYSGEASIA